MRCDMNELAERTDEADPTLSAHTAPALVTGGTSAYIHPLLFMPFCSHATPDVSRQFICELLEKSGVVRLAWRVLNELHLDASTVET
jgi:hypothetical protein